MSIHSELENATTYLRQARDTILNKGGEISATAGLKDLPSAIDSIPTDLSLTYETDDTTAYSKTVPSNAKSAALISKIGCMTRKSNNLIPYPYVSSSGERNGVTFTINSDYTITLNGTTTATTQFYLCDTSADKFNGSSFMFSGMPISGSTSTVFMAIQLQKANGDYLNGATLTSTTPQSLTWKEGTERVQAYIHIYAGVTFDNVVFKPMLNVGTTALPYEPYFAGFRTSKVTKIVSESKNILDISKALNANCVDNGDGTYTIKKTSSGRFSATFPLHIANGQGVCSYMELVEGTETDSTRIAMQLLDKNNNEVSNMSLVNGGGIYAPKACEYARFYIGGEQPDGTYITFKNPMVAYSGVKTPYAPYFAPISYDIPEEVLAIDGYGEGINDKYHNYIDLETKEFVRYVDTVVLDGSSTWRFNDVVGANYNYLFYNHSAPDVYNDTAILCDDYSSVTIWRTNNVGIDSYNDTSYFRVWVRPQDMNKYTTTAMWQEELAKNPMVIKIPRITPIREDISDKLGEFGRTIKVQGGGKVKFESEYDYAVPSTIQYVVEVE